MLGLPDGITACLFDLDGVLTKTAVVHERAWKRMFDEFLIDRGTFEQSDYDEFVDGKPREDGIRDFLASRDISPTEDEMRTLSSRKNDLVVKLIADEGVEAYNGSVACWPTTTSARPR
jgi:beta-phosphoglucomutase-like phosphatase (HAD superfamily)